MTDLAGLVEWVNEQDQEAALLRKLKDSLDLEGKSVGKYPVYFIESCGRVKIGTSADVERRVSAIATTCPYPVKILAVIPYGGYEVENLLHKRFAHLRAYREWFEADEELMIFIKKITSIEWEK